MDPADPTASVSGTTLPLCPVCMGWHRPDDVCVLSPRIMRALVAEKDAEIERLRSALEEIVSGRLVGGQAIALRALGRLKD